MCVANESVLLPPVGPSGPVREKLPSAAVLGSTAGSLVAWASRTFHVFLCQWEQGLLRAHLAPNPDEAMEPIFRNVSQVRN